MVQPRRHVQKAAQCLAAAYEVVERGEDARCAVDDIREALRHIDKVLPTLVSMAKGWERGTKDLFEEKRRKT